MNTASERFWKGTTNASIQALIQAKEEKLQFYWQLPLLTHSMLE